MVNDFRNLLANLTPTAEYGPGEIFIPPTYRPRVLDRFEQTIRIALFGRTPDRLMVNYRCFQLLRILSATRWSEAITAVDHRLTYDPWVWPGATVDWTKCTIVSAPGPVHVIGDINPSDAEGRALDTYQVKIFSTDTVNLFRGADFVRSINYEMGSGGSSLIMLGNSGIAIRFATEPTVDDLYIFTVPREPARSLGGIEAEIDRTVDFGTITALTEAGTDEQRMTTSNLWYRGTDTQSRLAGITMGLVNYARSRS